LERRPLRSRDWRWTNAVAGALARRGVSPDAISFAGLVSATLAGAALVATREWPGAERVLLLVAAAGVQGRLLANLLDGMVAVGSGRSSPVGPLWNEVPDRFSDAIVLVGAGHAVGGEPALGWLAALAAVLTAYVRGEARAAGAPNDFCGPMAKPHRMALVTVTAVVLALWPGDERPSVAGRGLWAAALAVVVLGCAVTIVRRLARAARALRGRAP
jgi:phosphatidylglycerophosphate synthase